MKDFINCDRNQYQIKDLLRDPICQTEDLVAEVDYLMYLIEQVKV
jgi:hypothetical protein